MLLERAGELWEAVPATDKRCLFPREGEISSCLVRKRI